MITQIRKFKNPFPMILALLSTFISIIDKLIFAKDIRIFSPVIAIGGAAFLLLILPYLIPVLCNKVKSERIRKILNWFSIGKRPGLMLSVVGFGQSFLSYYRQPDSSFIIWCWYQRP